MFGIIKIYIKVNDQILLNESFFVNSWNCIGFKHLNIVFLEEATKV